MTKRKTPVVAIPKFATEHDEANWWASAEGRKLLKAQPAQEGLNGSKLVGKLTKTIPSR